MISDIYEDLALTQVALNGQNVRVFNYDELPNSTSTDKLPCRLLIPFGVYPLEGVEWRFTSIGHTLVGEWTVLDLFLYKPASQGNSLQEFAPTVVEYIDNYTDMIQGLRAGLTPMKQAHVKAFAPQAGVFAWPQGGNTYYAGVMTLLQIQETRHG